VASFYSIPKLFKLFIDLALLASVKCDRLSSPDEIQPDWVYQQRL
jgi:hypothetical protein